MRRKDADSPLLMTPGPTRVPDRVLAAGARAMLHHRSRAFLIEFAELLELIQPIFGTKQPALLLPSTGRGGLEAAICSLFSAGDEVVMCGNGRFGMLWITLAELYGVVVHRVATDWTQSIDPRTVEAALSAHPRARAVGLTYCDTSTGVANDVAGIARAASRHNALVLVDGVSAIGGMPFAFDEWGIDIAVTASQKCLMSSPGLAIVAMSERALAATKHATLPRNYWDLADVHQHASKPRPDTVGTAPVHVVLQVVEALRMIHEEGFPSVCARHDRMGERARAGVRALGLQLQCPEFAAFSSTMTAVAAPAGVPPQTIRDAMEADGVLVAEGLGPYEPTAIRIGHMGDIRMADLDRTLEVLRSALSG